jgi:hypothetical protein
MADYGVTETGFRAKKLQEILASLQSKHRAAPALGPSIDTSPESPLGQIDATVAEGYAELWEAAQDAFNSLDPAQATKFALTVVSAITGTSRREAKASILRGVQATLNPGTTLVAGTTLASVNGRSDYEFTPLADITNGGGSPAVITGDWVCTQTGPIAANAGTLTVIVTQVSGWTNVTNPADAELGRVADTDPTLAARREKGLQQRGGSTTGAIRAALLDTETYPALSGIEEAFVLENTTLAIDVNGLPGKSVEVVIDDGPTPTVADNDVAQAIYESKGGGIQAFGSTTGFATDELGASKPIGFTRVTRKPVYIDATIVTNSKFPVDGNAQVKAAIKAAGEAMCGTSDDVIMLVLRAAPLLVAGVVDCTSLRLSFSPGPASSANLTVQIRERATFDTANMSVHT